MPAKKKPTAKKKAKVHTLDWEECIERCTWAEACDKDDKKVDIHWEFEDIHEVDMYYHEYGPGLPKLESKYKGDFFKFKNGPEGKFKITSWDGGHMLTERFDDEMVNFDDDNYACVSFTLVESA